ncbi:DUF1428 domain-containing protein [Rhizobium sp. 9140]|uniref:DUF1428 domain-containing protein n=1 Tax=Rhizobium sp. 9140 TaxID=1761900 RepID=UPI000794BD60|nr:DUF1428 family protein [Rhizobium sp. 9140]CZT35715.1 Uncharacterized conserved protein YbaA, DUF1428 family [Rhizobium sp. 9140]
MTYVDGFIVAVRRDRLDAYSDLARLASAVWKAHGALGYVECVGDDLPYGHVTSFPRAVQATADEVVIFAWIVYASKAERDLIVPRVMADPRLKIDPQAMPFDGQRMIYGGFNMLVQV